MPSENSTGSVSAQLSRNAARRPSTAGPAHPEVRVAPLVRVAGVALPLVGDAHSAGEAHLLVDDQDLAVGAVVQLERPESSERTEPPHHALRPRSMVAIRRAVDGAGTERIEEDAHPDAGARPAASRWARSVPIRPSQYTKVRKSIVCSRLIDRIDHRREDLVAVAQHVDRVALGCGYADDALEVTSDAVGRVPRSTHRRPCHPARQSRARHA